MPLAEMPISAARAVALSFGFRCRSSITLSRVFLGVKEVEGSGIIGASSPRDNS